MDQVPLIDQSGLYTLEDIVFDLEQGNTSITGQPTKQPMDKLRSIDIILT
jgi:SulP family sulfate permease